MSTTESRITLRVRYAETDQMGVVHHPKYFVWFENGRIDFLAQCGLDYAAMEQRGELFPVITCAARYNRPARFDDELTIRTVLLELAPHRIAFGGWLHDSLECDTPPMVKFHSVHAFSDHSLTARPIPQYVLTTLTAHVWSGSFFGRRRRSPPGF